MAVQSYKNPTEGEICNSTLVAAPPTALLAPPIQRFNRTHFSGVWLQHGDYTAPYMYYNASFLVGTDVYIEWSDIEVADGVFNFTLMDQQFAAAAAAGLYIMTALSLGDGDLTNPHHVPNWIYNRTGGNASVPKVLVDSDQGNGRLTFPYYLDPTYAVLFVRAVRLLRPTSRPIPPRFVPL